MFITLEKHACFWNKKMTWANSGRPLVWNSSRGWSQLHFLALTPLPCLKAWTGTVVGPQQDSYKNIVSKLRKLARFLQDWIWSSLGTKITDGAISSGKAFYLVPPSLPLSLLPSSFLLFSSGHSLVRRLEEDLQASVLACYRVDSEDQTRISRPDKCPYTLSIPLALKNFLKLIFHSKQCQGHTFLTGTHVFKDVGRWILTHPVCPPCLVICFRSHQVFRTVNSVLTIRPQFWGFIDFWGIHFQSLVRRLEF